MISRIAMLFLALTLAACAKDRPLETGCTRLSEFQTPKPGVRMLATAEASRGQSFEAALASAYTAPAGSGRVETQDRKLWSDALILSGGGQWGAYGAGFMQGWSAHGRLPARIVTGISTGGLQATFAYLGSAYDQGMVDAYSITSESVLVKRHGALFFLSHGSTADIAPLKRYIQQRVGPLLDDVKAEYDRTGRKLLVGAVDGLTGQFYVFDLSEMATKLSGIERLDCYTAALIASASVPVVFRQTTINGRPWLDGGVRHSMFLPAMLRSIAIARAQADRDSNAVVTDRRVYAIKNGTLEPSEVKELPAKLLPTVNRLRSIVFNQLDSDSLDLAGFHARSQRLEFYWTSADGWKASPLPVCTGQESGVEDAIFDPGFMQCMIAFGKSKWDVGSPWQRDDGPTPGTH